MHVHLAEQSSACHVLSLGPLALSVRVPQIGLYIGHVAKDGKGLA